MEPMKWGILGASKFAAGPLGPAIHAARGNKLVALASASANRLPQFQDFCPDIELFSDYDALLADPQIDAVYIPLPNHLHVDWTLRALAAGKHVLCEKPIALKAAEFDQLVAARDSCGLLAAEAFMIVHHPQWHLVRDLLQKGEIGRLTHVTGRFSFDNGTDVQNIRNRPETGGGALRDIGVYVTGAVRFVTGEEPETVDCRIRWENEVDVFSDIQARFPSFTYAAYVSTRMSPSQAMEFHGESGLIRLTAPFNPRVFGEASVEIHRVGHTGGGRIEQVRFSQDDQYVLQVEAFARAANEGTDYPCSLEFSRGTQAMIDACFEGAQAL